MEEALIGNGTEDFIEIFERQREHFKKHRELRGRIAESKNIEQKISHYVDTYTKLHEVQEEMLNKKREVKSIKEMLSIEIPDIQKKIQELIQYTTAKDKDLELMDQKHNEILDIVKGLRLEWHYLDLIYIKQESIIQYMEERLEKTKNEKENLLERERLSYRLLDFYGENEYFTGEPLLEEWLDGWKNQFNLLETGTRYIEKAAVNLHKNVEEIYMEYPLWSLAVITSEGELDKLSKKIEAQRERLTLPILILSQEEAVNILLGNEKVTERYIYPFIWEQNIDKKKFQLWKRDLDQSAQKAVEERKNKEKEEKYWQNILSDTNDFLSTYPYDRYTQLFQEVKDLKSKLYQYRNLLDEKQKESSYIDEEIQGYQDKLNNLEQESNYIGRKIERALDYFAKGKDKERLHEQLYKKNEELDLLKKEISSNEKDRERKASIVQDVREKIQDIKSQINKIIEDPDYKEVKFSKAIYKDINKDSLLEQREYIKDTLSEKQKGRLEIERQLKDAENMKERDEELLKRKYAAANCLVNEKIEYPYNGRDLIQRLLEDIKILKQEAEGILPSLREKEEIHKKNQHTYETRLEDFYKEYKEILHFTQPLPSVKEQISKEKTELEDKQKYLETRDQRLKEELEGIQNNIQNMDIKNGKYEFLLEDIETVSLPEEIKQNLPYNREKIIYGIIEEMEDLTGDLKSHEEIVDRERNQFAQFLNADVKDIRLREMAISGVRNKRVFEEIMEWQKNMDNTLNRVIRIHEKNMMEHDKELSQFIQYLYTYLFTLADEIRNIPKNTRVKIEDSWKEIFQIQVPGWEEKEGKEEIRKYVDWMISKLESDEFLDEEGKEDQGKIKKAVEKWLESKQLLKNIMGGEEIKVKCRKVTNDNKVSSMYYSWESSNQWSGGERWSKNMALFLGILNYVAEKRQHILPNQKRHRTVIMDNPFGKASSDHVLSPVFFIAEQLGFQFIALTAHGQGKFIRDYFPVVYSCKLRPAVEGDTSILTKEKNINYAFFKDNDPMVIERIGDIEQISILDI